MISNASTSVGQSTTSAIANHCTNAGPPILDIETANRVIENALSGSLQSNSTSNSNREQSAFNSDIINGHINSVLEQHTIETARELEALEHSSRNDKSDTMGSTSTGTSSLNPNNSTSVEKCTTNSISYPVRSSPVPPMPSDEEVEPEEENNDEEEKPLNLSASTVLHTSNQHIIDHFIDKLLSTGIESMS